MTAAPKILAFAGSARSRSFNKMLVRAAAAGATAAGAAVTEIDLRDYPMPLYDFDLQQEHGLPEEVRAFKALLLSHRGFLIAAPEYNGSVTPVLKNAIDWATRRETADEPQLACFKDKIAGVMTACQGGGGRNVQGHLRDILSRIGTSVVASRLTVTHAGDAFDSDGLLTDEHYRAAAEAIGAKVARLAAAMDDAAPT